MEAQWGVCAQERQYRNRQASLAGPLDGGKARRCPLKQRWLCRSRLGFTDAPGVRDQCRRGGGGRAGVRAWGPGAGGDGGVAVVDGGGRGRRHRGGDRGTAGTGGGEPDGEGLDGPLDQPEAVGSVPGPDLAGRSEGRPAGRLGAGSRAAQRRALFPAAGADRSGGGRVAGMVSPERKT